MGFLISVLAFVACLWQRLVKWYGASAIKTGVSKLVEAILLAVGKMLGLSISSAAGAFGTAIISVAIAMLVWFVMAFIAVIVAIPFGTSLDLNESFGGYTYVEMTQDGPIFSHQDQLFLPNIVGSYRTDGGFVFYAGEMRLPRVMFISDSVALAAVVGIALMATLVSLASLPLLVEMGSINLRYRSFATVVLHLALIVIGAVGGIYGVIAMWLLSSVINGLAYGIEETFDVVKNLNDASDRWRDHKRDQFDRWWRSGQQARQEFWDEQVMPIWQVIVITLVFATFLCHVFLVDPVVSYIRKTIVGWRTVYAVSYAKYCEQSECNCE
jgi:hypothetical protein